jgi:cell division septation protein DedD
MQPINDAQALLSSSNLSVEKANQATTFGLESDNLPKIWVLQVGEASDAETANKMLLRLRNKGHKAFIQPTGKTAENRCFVYVGPKIDLLTIQRDKTIIDRQFAATSAVVRYVR